MKILVVAHRFPPKHQTGAELYSWRLARRLKKEGHELVVFAADDDLMRRNYSVRTSDVDGLPVIEVQNHRLHRSFEETYIDPRMEARFQDVLRSTRPDLVHFQHLLHHSVRYPRIAREAGIPSVLTLHEYWLLCGRNGQMQQGDGTNCARPSLDTCARCLCTFMWGRQKIDLWMLRGLASVARLTGVDLKAQARRLRLRRLGNADPQALSDDEVAFMRGQLLLREASIRDMFEMVDAVIAPSPYLRSRFLEFGLDEESVILHDYGTDLKPFRGLERVPRGKRLRVGFMGSIQPVKGVHLLVQAMEDLKDLPVVATIHGDLSTKPEYVRTLRRHVTSSVDLAGKIPATAVPRFLSEIDVLVVPSTWWENSPLVIHEAFAAGVPVVCSGIGGMADLVEDGVSGLHFEPGNADDLAVKLRRLVEEKGLLERLAAGIPRIEDIRRDARFHSKLFEAVLAHHEELAAESDIEDLALDF